jgi:hypothetical protein
MSKNEPKLKEFRYVGNHVGDLEGGRQVAPGEFTGPIDPEAVQNAQLIDDNHLIAVDAGAYKKATGEDPPEPPTGEPGNDDNAKEGEQS